jgi:hypothetical protein
MILSPTQLPFCKHPYISLLGAHLHNLRGRLHVFVLHWVDSITTGHRFMLMPKWTPPSFVLLLVVNCGAHGPCCNLLFWKQEFDHALHRAIVYMLQGMLKFQRHFLFFLMAEARNAMQNSNGCLMFCGLRETEETEEICTSQLIYHLVLSKKKAIAPKLLNSKTYVPKVFHWATLVQHNQGF